MKARGAGVRAQEYEQNITTGRAALQRQTTEFSLKCALLAKYNSMRVSCRESKARNQRKSRRTSKAC
jgi:hypothetical protein